MKDLKTPKMELKKDECGGIAYEAPCIEVIEIQLEGVVAASIDNYTNNGGYPSSSR